MVSCLLRLRNSDVPAIFVLSTKGFVGKGDGKEVVDWFVVIWFSVACFVKQNVYKNVLQNVYLVNVYVVDFHDTHTPRA